MFLWKSLDGGTLTQVFLERLAQLYVTALQMYVLSLPVHTASLYH